MADRIFAGVLFLIAAGYTFIAFTAISAPFQYDPLGPESWPRLLGVVALLCTGTLIARPTVEGLEITRSSGVRLVGLIVLLLAYAATFQPLGFILSTFGFCVALSVMLGAGLRQAMIFGAAAGVLGYLVCTVLLDLNLPAGVLRPIL